MEGTEKPHMDEYKEVMNDWDYGASCTLTSLLVLYLENFQHLIFVAQSVHALHLSQQYCFSICAK
jgi:hypothetical protein